MSANKQKERKTAVPPGYRGELIERLGCAVETSSLSKELLRELAQEFGSAATQKAAAGALADLEFHENAIRKQLKGLRKHMGILFSETTAA